MPRLADLTCRWLSRSLSDPVFGGQWTKGGHAQPAGPAHRTSPSAKDSGPERLARETTCSTLDASVPLVPAGAALIQAQGIATVLPCSRILTCLLRASR